MSIATTFPPSGPTTLQAIIAAYLYREYADDDDIRAFFDAYNQLAQGYLDGFNDAPLAVYTDPTIAGDLCDWVIEGLYGLSRPILPSGIRFFEGPLNTYVPNELTPNEVKTVFQTPVGTGAIGYLSIGSGGIGVTTPTSPSEPPPITTDDVFKRILTWHFYKGDGKVFNVNWLKRRVMRFLFGYDGTDPGVDQTYRVGITFGTGNQVNIWIIPGLRTVSRAALANTVTPNEVAPNEIDTDYTPYPAIPMADTFKTAVDNGLLELPFQYSYVVIV